MATDCPKIEVSNTMKMLILFAILFGIGGAAFVGYKLGAKKEGTPKEEPKEEAPKKKVILNPNLKKQTTDSLKELTVDGAGGVDKPV